MGLVAYFSMEYMLSESLPIYSGGLGNVAGDQLKSASDLGVPVAAIGLLYQQGYFRQEIDSKGAQHALYPYNDPSQLPVTPLRQPDGEWLRIQMNTPGFKLWLRCWKVEVGRANLYLLDSNDLANPPAFRGVTSELYGGDSDLRLKQELILGIGGWRLLRALGLRPEICHLNEGHAAFAILERARSYMADNNVPFDVALAATRAGNLFTTHTAVEAGFDRFAPELAGKYLKMMAEELGIGLEKLLGLGRQNPSDASEPFNMAYLAVRGSGAVNGVSRLHGEVSRRLFSSLFPRWPEREVPVASRHQWSSRRHLGISGNGCALGAGLWAGSLGRRPSQTRAAPSGPSRHRSLAIANQRIERFDRVHAPAPGARASGPRSARRKTSPRRIGSSTSTRLRWDLRGASPLTSGPIFCCTIPNGWLAS